MGTPANLLRHSIIVCWTWGIICCLLALDSVWMHEAGIGLQSRTLYLVLGASLCLFTISLIYHYLRPDLGLWLMASVASQLILGTLALALFSYLSLRLGLTLQNDRLVAIDQSLGLNWQAYAAWVDARPVLARLFTVSYGATELEVLAVVAVLGLRRNYMGMHRFALQFLMGAGIAIAVAAVLPAVDAYEYYHVTPQQYPHLQVASTLAYLNDFYGMYHSKLSSLPVDLQGLVTFPSFHSTIAVIAIAAVPALPFAPLRALVVALNLLMLLSTPVDGGHYFIDTLGGIVIGVLVIAISRRVLPESTQG